jgi:hypothetical protein
MEIIREYIATRACQGVMQLQIKRIDIILYNEELKSFSPSPETTNKAARYIPMRQAGARLRL